MYIAINISHPDSKGVASPITKITSWFKFLGKNLYLVGCVTLCAKSEVMLLFVSVMVQEKSHISLHSHYLSNLVCLKQTKICLKISLATQKYIGLEFHVGSVTGTLFISLIFLVR